MLLESWPLAFMATVILEGLVAFVWGRVTRSRVPWLELLTLNLLTHPAAFYLASTPLDFAVIEAGVIVVEVVGYGVSRAVSWPQAIFLGTTCNLVSMLFSFV